MWIFNVSNKWMQLASWIKWNMQFSHPIIVLKDLKEKHLFEPVMELVADWEQQESLHLILCPPARSRAHQPEYLRRTSWRVRRHGVSMENTVKVTAEVGTST